MPPLKLNNRTESKRTGGNFSAKQKNKNEKERKKGRKKEKKEKKKLRIENEVTLAMLVDSIYCESNFDHITFFF